ncbi:MAG: amidohydrolase family protein [Chitinophagaceae bacterium]|nr:amidohydrolase family protein [Chitinophagaceae bacterium]
MRKIFAPVCFLLFYQFTAAQTIKAIKAGRLIDPLTGKVLERVTILVDHDTVRQVGQDIRAPDTAQIIDLSGYTVLPGLIDCHTHVTGQPSGDYYADIFRKSAVDDAVMAPTYALRTLMAGFTSCRDVGARGLVDVALRNAINRADIPGPRLFVATLFIGSTGSHGDLNGFSPYLQWNDGPKELSGVANGVEGVRQQVRFNVKYGADVIKFGASAGVLTEEESVGAPQYTQAEMNAIVDEAHLWGRKACAHAHGTEAIKMAVKAGVASIEHGSMLDEEAIRMMKERGTYLVADIYNDDYILSEYARLGFPDKIINKERQVGLVQRESFRKAAMAGVKIAFGTDAGVYPHGWNARQFFYMVKYGLTPLQAIQAATSNAADLIGNPRIGTIRPGSFADIIAVKDDPLKDIKALERVGFVMKGGVVYKKD